MRKLEMEFSIKNIIYKSHKKKKNKIMAVTYKIKKYRKSNLIQELDIIKFSPIEYEHFHYLADWV